MRLEQYLSGSGQLMVDLYVEKEAGSSVMIPMGDPELALRNYRRLRRLCDAAIKVLEPKVEGGRGVL